ncbi:hypothetical protein L0337_18300 [candidate division KSB1 bacterium]|nr:hypothetical protein [candidate division KSB1 bacterium]
MIVCDTNILSTFARVGILDLLFKLFPNHEFVIPPAVYKEINEAIQRGMLFLETVQTQVDSGQICVLALTSEEEVVRKSLPRSFGLGEAEGVAICIRQDAVFLSNDKRVRNYCQEHGIAVYDLIRLLRALWENKIVSRHKVHKIVNNIERLEEVVFKNKKDIFKD